MMPFIPDAPRIATCAAAAALGGACSACMAPRGRWPSHTGLPSCLHMQWQGQRLATAATLDRASLPRMCGVERPGRLPPAAHEALQHPVVVAVYMWWCLVAGPTSCPESCRPAAARALRLLGGNGWEAGHTLQRWASGLRPAHLGASCKACQGVHGAWPHPPPTAHSPCR